MAKTHILPYDGYTVGDRLLEGVIFHVEIMEDRGRLTIGAIEPSPQAQAYLASIRWENFVPAMRADIQSRIDHYVPWVASEGRTLRGELEAHANATGEAEIEVLNEV